MRLFLILALLVAASPYARAADLGVSVSIGQPGFFGRLDLGDYPPPQLMYQQPRTVRRVPADRPPVYLNVPPGHAKDWRRYCGRYDACDERVYFVRNNWYDREYAPRYQQRNERHDAPGNEGPHNGHRGGDQEHGRNR